MKPSPGDRRGRVTAARARAKSDRSGLAPRRRRRAARHWSRRCRSARRSRGDRRSPSPRDSDSSAPHAAPRRLSAVARDGGDRAVRDRGAHARRGSIAGHVTRSLGNRRGRCHAPAAHRKRGGSIAPGAPVLRGSDAPDGGRPAARRSHRLGAADRSRDAEAKQARPVRGEVGAGLRRRFPSSTSTLPPAVRRRPRTPRSTRGAPARLIASPRHRRTARSAPWPAALILTPAHDAERQSARAVFSTRPGDRCAWCACRGCERVEVPRLHEKARATASGNSTPAPSARPGSTRVDSELMGHEAVHRRPR